MIDVREHEGLILYCLKRKGMLGNQDAFQTAYVALLQAAKAFNPGSDTEGARASFAHYAITCIMRELFSVEQLSKPVSLPKYLSATHYRVLGAVRTLKTEEKHVTAQSICDTLDEDINQDIIYHVLSCVAVGDGMFGHDFDYFCLELSELIPLDTKTNFEIFIRHAILGCSAAELADFYSLSVKGVYNRIHRFREKAKSFLGEAYARL